MGRALGDADCGSWLSPEPACFTLSYTDTLDVMICSDGVWDAMTVEEGSETLRNHQRATHDAQKTCDTIIRQSIHNRLGLYDDTTCLTVHVVHASELSKMEIAPIAPSKPPLLVRGLRRLGLRKVKPRDTSTEKSGSNSDYSVKGGSLYRIPSNSSPCGPAIRGPDQKLMPVGVVP